MSPCKSRHHKYVDNVCTKCGQPYRPPGRPKKLAGPEGSARLAATLGVPAPAASSGGIFSSAAGPAEGAPLVPDLVSPPAKPEEKAAALADTAAAAVIEKKEGDKKEPSKASKKLWAKVSRKLTKVFLSATDAAIEAFDGKDFEREPGDADDEDVEDFEENLGECMATWFPDTELGPGKACILAGAMIIGDKCLGSTKVPKARPSIAGETKPEVVQDAPTATTAGNDAAAPAAASTSELTLVRTS